MIRAKNPGVPSLQMPLANQSHGDITHYVVTWANTTETEQQNRKEVAHNKHHLSLSLDTTEEYTVTVTAINKIGRSSPSTITVPRFSPGMKLRELYTLQV